MESDFQLRDGSITGDPRLDRLKQFDERSRAFGITEIVPRAVPFRGYTWKLPIPNLDQGNEGACVGFSLAQRLAARPVKWPNVTDTLAYSIYRNAQQIDPWPGEDYSGTSVLAGVKVLHNMGWISEYRWAFGLDEMRRGIGYTGPAVIGVNWHADSYYPDDDGFIRPTGEIVGGHAIMVNAVSERHKYFTLQNSWGEDWGHSGECYMTFDDMAKLLDEDGECVFVKETKKP